MAVRDKLQTPSNAEMVLSLSVGEAISYCSLLLIVTSHLARVMR
jgi:hypothetical protein